MSDDLDELTKAEQRGYANAMEAERKLHEDRIEQLERDLAKAVEALREIAGSVPYADNPWQIALAALAALEGKDE